MTEQERREIALRILEFHKCPNSGLVIHSSKHDDKVLCRCGKLSGAGEEPGVHVKARLQRVSVDDFLKQEVERKRAERAQ